MLNGLNPSTFDEVLGICDAMYAAFGHTKEICDTAITRYVVFTGLNGDHVVQVICQSENPLIVRVIDAYKGEVATDCTTCYSVLNAGQQALVAWVEAHEGVKEAIGEAVEKLAEPDQTIHSAFRHDDPCNNAKLDDGTFEACCDVCGEAFNPGPDGVRTCPGCASEQPK